MFQIYNDTPFETAQAVLLSGTGSQFWVVVIKATFTLRPDGSVELAKEQEPVSRVPQYRGDPLRSSLVRDCEVVLDHPGTEIVLNGAAHARAGTEVDELEVGFRVGELDKRLTVRGDSYWEQGIFGTRRSPPVPFTSVPLVYERAYGGYAPNAGESAFDQRNPAGRGYTLEPPEDGQALPNIENPGQRIVHWKDQPAPAGFGAIASWWSPRSSLAGTFDQIWQERRMPLWPLNYDPRYHLAAPWDQVLPEPPELGAQVDLWNLTPGGLLRFNLPKVYPVVQMDVGAERYRQQTRLERIILEPEESRLLMVWRAWRDCGRDVREVQRALVWTKQVLG